MAAVDRRSIARRLDQAAGNWRAVRPTTFSAIVRAVGRQHFPRGQAPAAVASRDQELVILPAEELTDRVGPAATLVPDDRVTARDRCALAAPAADGQVFPAAAKEVCVRIDPEAVVTAPDSRAVATDQEDLAVTAIGRDVPVMEIALGIVREDRVTGPVKVAAVSSGGRAIDRDVPVIDRTIVPTDVPIGTSGKIGETIAGLTSTTTGTIIGITTGTTITVGSAATGGTTIRTGGSTTTSTIGVGPPGRP